MSSEIASSFSVFKSLHDHLPSIREGKAADLYGRAPYVKLQTRNEDDPEKVEVFPYIINQGSYSSLLYKAYAGTRNYTANTMNASGWSGFFSSWSSGYVDLWNCNRQKTAEALETALTKCPLQLESFQNRLKEGADEKSLQTLFEEISEIQLLLRGAKKTIYYIYRTYTSSIDASEEELTEKGEGPEEIYLRYQSLSLFLEDLIVLQEMIEEKKRELKKEPALEKSDWLKSSLRFSNEADASRWFCHQIDHCRRKVAEQNPQINSVGFSRHKDLASMTKVSGKTPDSFQCFAKMIDRQLKKACREDKIAARFFVQDVYQRFTERLQKKEIKNPMGQDPDDFQIWLKELTMNYASLEVYQTLFQSLTNLEGTGPYRLDLAPSVLNAIMVDSFYFPLFDPT